MSVARFGTNILVDGGTGFGSALYNATVTNRLQQLSMSAAGRAAIASVARRLRSLRIVPPSAPQPATARDVVVFYASAAADVDGKQLLDALLLATPSATSGSAPGVRGVTEIHAVKLHDVASTSLWREV